MCKLVCGFAPCIRTKEKFAFIVSLQWWEENARLQNGSQVRVQLSCYVSSRGVNNWLRTPFMGVKDVNRLYVKITFAIKKCAKLDDPSLLQNCKESFNLYYLEPDGNFANDSTSSWNGLSYTMIDKVTADHTFESTDNYIWNTEVRSISLSQGARGVYLAFQDTGACVILQAIQIFYKLCPKVTHNYAVFNQTPAGSFQTSVVAVDGHCVPHADIVLKPTYHCMVDGTWNIPLGGCHCVLGYSGNGMNMCTSTVSFSFALRKHAYSNILKNLSPKKRKFSDKII